MFYASREKILQDAFILKYISTTSCQRRRPRVGNRKAKDSTIRCFVLNGVKQMVLVCKEACRSILRITKHRIAYMSNQFKKTGASPRENRGGNHKNRSYEPKREAVQKFIKRLKCVEYHYCRSKSGVRKKYLPSHLNIVKLHKAYSDQCNNNEKVKLSLGRL